MSSREDTEERRARVHSVLSFLADKQSRSALVAFFRKSPRAEVDDLVQRTLLAALQSVDRYKGESAAHSNKPRSGSRVKAFVLGVARYTLYERFRERRREEELHALSKDKEREASESNDDVSDEDILGAIEGALSQLPASLRDVVTMFYFEQQTQAEIADRLRLPPGTVASRLRRAREALREELRREVL